MMQNVMEHLRLVEVQDTCEQHGPYTAKTLMGGKIRIGCPACLAERKKAEDAERHEREREEAAKRWQQRLGAACIPLRFTDRTLDTFTVSSEAERKALAVARAYTPDDVQQTGRSLIIVGPPGTGKTHISVGIGNAWLRAGKTVLFRGVMQAVQMVTETWRKDSAMTQTEAMALLANPDLLILDEVGVQTGSDAERNVIFELMNTRYERRLPTILLSNLAVNELHKYLGERVLDRLREDGGKVIVLDGESHRGAKK